MNQHTAPLTIPANNPATSQIMARSARRSGSGLLRASARPSRNPQRSTAIANATTNKVLNVMAFAGDALPPVDRRRINVQITEELNASLGFHLTDTFCGFKGYRVAALQGR